MLLKSAASKKMKRKTSLHKPPQDVTMLHWVESCGRSFGRAQVRFGYRTCCEANEEFKSLYAAASQLFREWNSDEEHWYKVDAYTPSL